MSRFGGHYPWKNVPDHPLARLKHANTGSASDIRKRLERPGTTLSDIARDTGLPIENLRHTLDSEAFQAKHPDGVQFNARFGKWMRGVLTRLMERALAVAKTAGLIAGPKTGRPYAVPREHVVQLLADFNGDVPVVSLLSGLSESTVRRIIKEIGYGSK